MRAWPLWGSERIRGELLKLGIVVSNRSIRRYRWRRFCPRDDHQRWRTFLSNELHGIWAADLFVVQTVSYCILYVFFLLGHDRREWIHFNVTASPTAAWIWQQVLEASPLGRQPKLLIHDRDADYGGDFDERLAKLGIRGCERRRGRRRRTPSPSGSYGRFGPSVSTTSS